MGAKGFRPACVPLVVDSVSSMNITGTFSPT